MNAKSLVHRTLAALLWSAMTISVASHSGPDFFSRDTMSNFQLGNYSFELGRVNSYTQPESSSECFGHSAKHAQTVMEKIETFCGPVTYPAEKPAGMILRESNYFDCGRDQLRVDVVDEADVGQNCVVRFINANGKEWISGGVEAKRRESGALLGLVVAVGVLAVF